LLRNIWGCGQNEPNESLLLSAILSMGEAKHTVTKLYKILLTRNSKTLTQVKLRWDSALTTPLAQKTWDSALTSIKSVSRNFRLRYTQFNY
ncbi:hypothetical protein NDU88_003944, partial [Pleurodeles waltl]